MFRLFSTAIQKGTFPQLPRLKNVSVSVLAPHPAVGYSILKRPVIKTNTLITKNIHREKQELVTGEGETSFSFAVFLHVQFVLGIFYSQRIRMVLLYYLFIFCFSFLSFVRCTKNVNLKTYLTDFFDNSFLSAKCW